VLRPIAISLTFPLLFYTTRAFAVDETPLAISRGCLACHDVHETLAGPAYLSVAKRYGPKDKEKLVKKVLNGGAGSWGAAPMPANKDNGVTDADARRLVDWILSLND